MRTRFIRFVWTFCIFIGAQHSAWAQSSLYFDRGSFINACQAVPGNQQSISYFGGANGPVLTISDVTFQGRYLGTGPPTGFLYNFDGTSPLSIHFANGARAFGGDFSSYLSSLYLSFTATLSLGNGETFQFTAPTDPNYAFFGFISPTPIRDLTFSDGGLFGTVGLHEELLGNVYTVTVIPEPAAIVLAGFGAALLLGWRFHKRKS